MTSLNIIISYLHFFEHTGVGRDGLVYIGEVVEDEVDLEVRDQLHETLPGPDHVGGPHLHLQGVLLSLGGPGHLVLLLHPAELHDLAEVVRHALHVILEEKGIYFLLL